MLGVIRAAAVLLALAALSVGASSADASPGRVFAARVGADASVSSNWAGYAVTGTNANGLPTSYTDVTGSWVQPKVTCSRGTPSYSAFWVGLGGFSPSSQALEQIGTESNCDAAGRPIYAAWYEIVPAPSIPIRMKIAPGDRMTAAVLVQGTQVVLQLTNATRHLRATQRVTVPQPDLTSAEWIAEAPSSCTSSGGCTTLPLANFGSVSFTRSATTGDAHAGTITEPAWGATAIELAESSPGSVDPRYTGTAAGSGAAPSSTVGRRPCFRRRLEFVFRLAPDAEIRGQDSDVQTVVRRRARTRHARRRFRFPATPAGAGSACVVDSPARARARAGR